MKSGWPIGAGHPCIGCTEKHFFDRFTPFYSTLPDVEGLGIEASAEKVGWGLIGVAAVGTAIHGSITTVKSMARRRGAHDEELLAAFGEVDDHHHAGGLVGRNLLLAQIVVLPAQTIQILIPTTVGRASNSHGYGKSCH